MLESFVAECTMLFTWALTCIPRKDRVSNRTDRPWPSHLHRWESVLLGRSVLANGKRPKSPWPRVQHSWALRTSTPSNPRAEKLSLGLDRYSVKFVSVGCLFRICSIILFYLFKLQMHPSVSNHGFRVPMCSSTHWVKGNILEKAREQHLGRDEEITGTVNVGPELTLVGPTNSFGVAG